MNENKLINYYMDLASRTAELSYCKRRQVGALIVSEDFMNILAFGYNGTPSGDVNCCEDENGETKETVLHAETNAIAKLLKTTQTSINAKLFVTLSPCIHCAKLIYQAGIKTVYYRDKYRCTDGLDFLIRHKIQCLHLDIY